jgi:D-glycero-beta-D-manno-heptose 1-phosphate adenylyltransferase
MVRVGQVRQTGDTTEDTTSDMVKDGQTMSERGAAASEQGGQGSDLVVATGVFDLLHIGHLRFLEAARRLGDSLIVGVESDARVRRWKGPRRPIQSEEDRCALVEALKVVDHVFTIVGARTDPAFYVELLRPLHARYLAVTADDPLLEVKREAMATIGVELCVVVPRIENYSTTRLVELLGLY